MVRDILLLKECVRKFKIELQFSVSDIDLNNLYLKTPRG